MSSDQKPLPFQLINAFAATPRAGNQAAVVVIPKEDPRATDAEYMQAVAKDFNLSETAFLVPLGSSGEVPKYGLRWFTPAAVSCDSTLPLLLISKLPSSDSN